MSYSATAIKVMIASPGDVAAERGVAREVINEWNSIHSEDKSIVLMPVGWESHTSPAMGGRAQEIINTQVLENSDLLVAVFWTRLGTPTGGSPSGTVEEIEKHIRAGKPTMIYFSSAPVRLESVNEEQYHALRDFKESCRQRGLIEQYETIDEFRGKLARQLAQTILRNYQPEASAESTFQSGTGGINQVFNLSDAAKELIIEASKDENGIIIQHNTLSGYFIQTNKKTLNEIGNPRSEARYKSALDSLYREGLIEDRSGKGTVLTLTDRGYQVADRLRNSA